MYEILFGNNLFDDQSRILYLFSFTAKRKMT